MEKFKISLERSLASLTVTIILLVIFSIASVFIYFIEMNKIILYGIWVIFIIMNFPVLLLHINYWFTDKNKVIQFDPDNLTITLTVGEKTSTYSFDDVKNVTLTENSCFDKSGPLKVNRRTPWSEYFYYQIDLNNNKKIFLTSLSIKQTEFPLEVNQRRYEMFQATN